MKKTKTLLTFPIFFGVSSVFAESVNSSLETASTNSTGSLLFIFAFMLFLFAFSFFILKDRAKTRSIIYKRQEKKLENQEQEDYYKYKNK